MGEKGDKTSSGGSAPKSPKGDFAPMSNKVPFRGFRGRVGPLRFLKSGQWFCRPPENRLFAEQNQKNELSPSPDCPVIG
jgi:hypothetical protein